MTDKALTHVGIAKPLARRVQKAVAASLPTVRCDAASLLRLIKLTSQGEPVTSSKIVFSPRQKQKDAWRKFVALTGKG